MNQDVGRASSPPNRRPLAHWAGWKPALHLLLIVWFLLIATWCGAAADVSSIVTTLMDDERALNGVPFAEVVRAATGKEVIPINLTNAIDRELVGKIGRAMDKVMRSLNTADSPARAKRRINEVSALFEAAIKTELNEIPGFECDYPETASGARQRSGYPDLRLFDKTSGRVTYLDPKLFEQGSRASSFRTFYFEPKKETNKVLEDAHHLLVGFEHDGKADGAWKFLSWELVDLSKFQVKLKAEFQGSNRDLYRPEAIIGSSKTNFNLTTETQRH